MPVPDPASKVAEALARLAALEEQELAAREAVSTSIKEARDANVSWEELAEATDVTVRRLKWARVQGDPELLAKERERQSRLGTRRPTLPAESGVSVADAARELGMSRAALYKRIEGTEAGEIAGWTYRPGERGKTRFYRPGE